MSMNLFHNLSKACSRLTTETYSTSFASAIRLLHADLREPVYNIYGFVRFADEIVDTFHEFDKAKLLEKFKKETFQAIAEGISLNPILHSFQQTVRAYNIEHRLIHAFFKSMEMDLYRQRYNDEEYREYIYGSAEVVGLMCLQVFCEKDEKRFYELEPAARSLGAAFQKVNFLRDANADHEMLSRTYFPGIDFLNFDPEMKRSIEADIEKDFEHAYTGIRELPWKARFGVYVAYKYYLSLFKKIRTTQPSAILQRRIRIPNYQKAMILARAEVKNRLNMI